MNTLSLKGFLVIPTKGGISFLWREIPRNPGMTQRNKTQTGTLPVIGPRGFAGQIHYLAKKIFVKTIALFGAGKSATVLIDYLSAVAQERNWKFIVADANKEQALAKTKGAPATEAVGLDITDDDARAALVQRAHVVISMMPPALHFLVAKDCVEYRKHLLTASYLDDKMRSLRDEINDRKLLFLCEMGLDPGIDHMSAMQIIDGIRKKGGSVTSFKSHCGGLVAPESDNNPWRYKISWNPRNIVMAGSAGADYKRDNQVIHTVYRDLFDVANTVKVEGLDELAFYPNRDSLSYIPVYKLPEAKTFIRTTLRYPVFFSGWNAIVHAGLTNDKDPLPAGLSFREWSKPVEPFMTDANKAQLEYLGLFDESPVPVKAVTSADVLQHLAETKLAMRTDDKDMIVMLHEFEYETEGVTKSIQSSLVVEGENNLHTAMAKTVGLPLGIAAKLILEDKLSLTGLHIPTSPLVYEPVLAELAQLGVQFTETES